MDLQLYFEKQLDNWGFIDSYPYPNLAETEFKDDETRA